MHNHPRTRMLVITSLNLGRPFRLLKGTVSDFGRFAEGEAPT